MVEAGRADGGVGAVRGVVMGVVVVDVEVVALQLINAPRRALELGYTVRRGYRRRGGTSLDYCCCYGRGRAQRRRR